MGEIEREYEAREVVVLAVNVWEEEGVFHSFVEGTEHDLHWVRADEETIEPFGLGGVPAQLIIDREGTVRWTSGFFSLFSGTDTLRKNLDRVLEE